MTNIQPGSFESTWGEYGAEEWSDALMASMKLGGIDNLFFVSGSEIAFYQESAAKAREREWPTPRLVTMTHEGAALHAALGNAMVSGQPAATAVHVDVGTLNYGAAIHTAWRGGYPVLMTAGTGPRAYPGTMRGGRDAGIQWVQEPRDQGEIVRQYTKHDHRLEHLDNPGLMVSRLLQVAMSDPQGPVYMTVPREVAMQPMPGIDSISHARPARRRTTRVAGPPRRQDRRGVARQGEQPRHLPREVGPPPGVGGGARAAGRAAGAARS